MKNFKNMTALIALIAFSNKCAVTPRDKNELGLLINQMKNNPQQKLTANQEKELNRFRNMNDSYVQGRLKEIAFPTAPMPSERPLTDFFQKTTTGTKEIITPFPEKINPIPTQQEKQTSFLSTVGGIPQIVQVNANQPIQHNVAPMPLQQKVAPMPPVRPLSEIPVKPVFTGGLTELAPTKPMKEEYPTSFSSTVGSIDQPVVKIQNVSLAATELGRGRLVQQTASIPVKLTLQSILDGALGEPYTSKANFINKTGYADSLNKDINRDINASYRPEYESSRIDSIKRTIDKLYGFASR